MTSQPAAPFEIVTLNDRGAQVTIPNCMLIVFSGIVVLSRAFARLRVTGLTKVDDLAILFSLVFAIAQTVCTQLAVNHSLGRRQALVSPGRFVRYSKLKFNYASQLLTVLSMGCAKVAVSRLIIAIEPKRALRHACYALEVVFGLWAVTSVFTLAFQCDLPRPWVLATNRCSNLRGIYFYVEVMNILTDIVLATLPIPLLWGIRLKASKKILVIGLFGTRILVPAATIILLVYLSTYLERLDEDQTWNSTVPALLLQIVMNLSIITACIPSLRRIVTDLRTDQTGLKVSENLELSIAGSTKFTGTGQSKTNTSAGTQTQSSGRSGSKIKDKRPNRSFLGRQSSEEHLTDQAITHTLEYSVEEDDAGSLPSHRKPAQLQTRYPY